MTGSARKPSRRNNVMASKIRTQIPRPPSRKRKASVRPVPPRPKGELERLAVRRRAAMQYRLAGASYRSIAEKLTEDRANAYADANGIGLPITMCPLSQMMSERRMKPQASSPRAATGRLRLPIQT